MQSITLCLESPTLEQPFVMACQALGINLRIVNGTQASLFKGASSDWTIVSGSLDQLQLYAKDCISNGKNPRTHLVRVIDQAWGQYFFHDLPVFASIVAPANEQDATHVLNKLSKAKDFLRQNSLPSADSDVATRKSEEWIKASPQLATTFEMIHRVATKPVDILVFGETGSGKDILAKYIHATSARKGNFVHINCAALPDQLIESELFGVEAGAYTGATKSRPGKIEHADGGTLYLDEIDSMSLLCQAKFLTALQDRGAERLGGNKFIKSSFRVIASTKVDLSEHVAQGKFRQDLLFRIQVVTLNLPPLRQRMQDIPLLFEYFCTESAKLYEVPTPEIPAEVRHALLTHNWPGNVRELKATAERFVLGMPLTRVSQHTSNTGQPSLKEALREYERQLIRQALQANNGVVIEAAKVLGLSQHNLYYRMKQLGVGTNDV
jgi:DNA-binding NtrC family response regulator